MTTKRIGFACKWIDNESQIKGIPARDAARQFSTCTTTLAWLNRQSRTAAYDKLLEIVQHNLQSVYRLIAQVGLQEPAQRIVRLSSEVLPMYTETTYRDFYTSAEVKELMERQFAAAGKLAQGLDVRLSFHPGQFTVLASERPDVVEKSIEEFEYHARMAEMLGYGRRFQDMKINVHIAGRLGAAGIRRVYPRLSAAAQRCITVENEENNYNTDSVLLLADILPIVLDLHHHWIHYGEYIQHNDPRIDAIVDSWRGVRPVLHYSQSPRGLLAEHSVNVMPNLQKLLQAGHKRAQLRAHSDFFWNHAVNCYALQFIDRFDIMCESKAKNLASTELYHRYVKGALVNDTDSNWADYGSGCSAGI